MPKSERSNYTSLDFVQWSETNSLVLTPKFQRRGVWTDSARSLLIDTLLQEMPVPPIYLRVRQSDDKTRIIREVVDGQQRIAAILKFIGNELRLSKTLKKEWAGRRFSELSVRQQDQVRQYSFNCEVFQAISDKEILDIFTRLNTYSIPLNNQELRNGRFFGPFKQSAYELAHDYLEFWRNNRIFGERPIARMLEVELTSELMIAQLDGMQDKKKSIDTVYERYDEAFPDQKRTETRFASTLNEIQTALHDVLPDSEFRRVPLFYSLFCTVYHRAYGLPKAELSSPKRPLTNAEKQTLRSAVAKLSELISRAKEEENIPESSVRFVTACLRQTDNLEPRRVRFQTLYREAF